MTIPIKFEYNGKEYTGHFSSVTGAGNTNTWRLMIDNYYRGQFIYTEKYGWRFTSQSGAFQDLSGFFEFYMVSWFA